MALTIHDGGYKSRKLFAFILTDVLLLVAYFVSKKLGEANFSALGTCMVMAFGAYCGANVARDNAALKHGATIVPLPAKPAAKDDKKDEEEGS
jgi:hypothetical protein